MPLSHDKPNERLMAELLDVRDAVADVRGALAKTNWLPDDFEKGPLGEFLDALKILPDGTAAGAHTTLRATKVELQEFEDRHFLTQTQIDKASADTGVVNKLSRHSDLGKSFRLLKSAYDSALAECRRQAGTRPDEEERPENEVRHIGYPSENIRAKAQAISASMQKAHADIDEIADAPLPEKMIVTRILVDAEQLSLTTAAAAALSSASQWVTVQLGAAWENLPGVVDLSMNAFITAINVSQYSRNEIYKVQTEISDVLHDNARDIAQDLQSWAQGKSETHSLPPLPSVDPDVQKKAEEQANALLRAGKVVPADIGPFVRKIGEESDQIALSDFSSLENCPYVTAACLGKSQAINFNPLSKFKYLRRLDLDSSQILDVSALSGLTGLQYLDLTGTQVSELDALSGLTRLQVLDLMNTQVSGLDALSGLTRLQTLYLGGTQVSELDALSSLTGLQYLDLAGTQVSELDALSGLTRLQVLDLMNTQVSGLDALSGLTGLQVLYLNDTQVSELGVLSGLTGLQTLDLNNTQVSELDVLSGLTGLQALDLGGTKVTELDALSGLTGLQTLDLSNTQVSELDALSGLTGLQVLHLNDTHVSELDALSGLTGLQVLDLSNAQVSGLDALSGLTGLQVLYLNDTQVSELGALSGLTRLQVLDLRNAQVSGLDALSGLTRLQALYLSDTKVTDWSPVDHIDLVDGRPKDWVRKT